MNRNVLRQGQNRKLADVSRPGFTLLELVLAASLSLLVMSGMAGVVLMIYQVQTTNSDHVTTVQVGRNLLKQFEWDLQAIPGVLPVDTASQGSLVSSSSTLQSVDESLSSSATLAFEPEAESGTALPEFLLRGDSSTINFYAEPILRTGKQRMLAIQSNEDQENLLLSRRRFISWGLIESSELSEIPQGMSAESITRVQRIVEEGASGDITFHHDDELFVPEKIAMQFSYFDGSTWVDSWDSDEQLAMPKAIEVVLTLQIGVTEAGNRFVSSNTAVKQWTTRRVFLIPTQRFSATSSASADSSSL